MSDEIVQVAMLSPAKEPVPADSVPAPALVQVKVVNGELVSSIKLTVPPAGMAGPPSPTAARKVTAVPRGNGLELPVCSETATVGVA